MATGCPGEPSHGPAGHPRPGEAKRGLMAPGPPCTPPERSRAQPRARRTRPPSRAGAARAGEGTGERREEAQEPRDTRAPSPGSPSCGGSPPPRCAAPGPASPWRSSPAMAAPRMPPCPGCRSAPRGPAGTQPRPPALPHRPGRQGGHGPQPALSTAPELGVSWGRLPGAAGAGRRHQWQPRNKRGDCLSTG